MSKIDTPQKTVSPQLIVLMGMPLTGKSTVAKLLAEKLTLTCLDINQAHLKIDPTYDPTKPQDETQVATNLHKAYIHNHQQALKLLRQGKSVILVGTYAQPEFQQMLLDLAQVVTDISVIPKLFLFAVTESSIIRRLRHRTKLSAEQSNIHTMADYHHVQSKFQVTSLQKFTKIQTDDLSADQIALLIMDIIE